MECSNGSYITQFLHKYVHMFSSRGILSSRIFFSFFCSKDVYARARLCGCSYDRGLGPDMCCAISFD